jgi:hypothetical protein
MHIEVPNIDINAAINAGPIETKKSLGGIALLCLTLGVVVFFTALWTGYPPALLWASFFISLLFWMGVSVGAVMTTVIFQIVRALWAVPIRRIAEANIAFLPWAYLLLLCTYFGKEHLYPWANAPMPGREWWMQPDFVYARFAILFLAFFYLLYRFTRHSLRSDIGVLREHATNKDLWRGNIYKMLVSNWRGEEVEVLEAQKRMSFLAPIIVVFYALLWTLFATEMIKSMDKIWFSNMYGGFEFLANIYTGWAMIAVISIYVAKRHLEFGKNLRSRQLWDLGLLTFGFCMLYGYTFFSQFLVQWYGNLPEETQWLIIRTREMPWKAWSYVALSLGFVIPFITLLSRDVKRNPGAFTLIACLIFAGIWLTKYIVIIPQFSPDFVPFNFVDVAIFLGIMGIYILSVRHFLSIFPFMTVSHPQAKGDVKSW